jgi:hypothetical protein
MVIGCFFERDCGGHTGELEAALARKLLDKI